MPALSKSSGVNTSWSSWLKRARKARKGQERPGSPASNLFADVAYHEYGCTHKLYKVIEASQIMAAVYSRDNAQGLLTVEICVSHHIFCLASHSKPQSIV
jgi:hypothetical protein